LFHGRTASFSFPASDHNPISTAHSPRPQRTPIPRYQRIPPSSFSKSRRYAQRAQHAKTKYQEAIFARDKNKSRTVFKSSTANAIREIKKEHGFVPNPGMNEWTNARELLLRMTGREYKNYNKTYAPHDPIPPSIRTPPSHLVLPPNSSTPSPASTSTTTSHPLRSNLGVLLGLGLKFYIQSPRTKK